MMQGAAACNHVSCFAMENIPEIRRRFALPILAAQPVIPVAALRCAAGPLSPAAKRIADVSQNQVMQQTPWLGRARAAPA